MYWPPWSRRRVGWVLRQLAARESPGLSPGMVRAARLLGCVASGGSLCSSEALSWGRDREAIEGAPRQPAPSPGVRSRGKRGYRRRRALAEARLTPPPVSDRLAYLLIPVPELEPVSVARRRDGGGLPRHAMAALCSTPTGTCRRRRGTSGSGSSTTFWSSGDGNRLLPL